MSNVQYVIKTLGRACTTSVFIKIYNNNNDNIPPAVVVAAASISNNNDNNKNNMDYNKISMLLLFFFPVTLAAAAAANKNVLSSLVDGSGTTTTTRTTPTAFVVSSSQHLLTRQRQQRQRPPRRRHSSSSSSSNNSQAQSQHQSQATWTYSTRATSSSSSSSRLAATSSRDSDSNNNNNNNKKSNKPPHSSSMHRLKTAVNIPPGEAQRQFRRTIFTHDDWIKHRNQNRFIVYLAAMWKSGMYKNLCQEVLLTTSVAALLVYYNAVVGGYSGFPSINGGLPPLQYPALINIGLPILSLPLSVFYLTSPALSLLLVFRINTSYQRWDEGRKYWQYTINHTRDLLRMANAYYDTNSNDYNNDNNNIDNSNEQQRLDNLQYVALCTWIFCRAMKRHLSPDEEDEINFQQELNETIQLFNNNNSNNNDHTQQQQQQADIIITAYHRPNRALQDLSTAIENNLPMHFVRKHELHHAVSILQNNIGHCERILTSPVPLEYSRHLARFLVVWLMLLPFGLYNDPFMDNSWNHVIIIPITTIISIMLFAIEEIATQLAEPFTILPMQAFCDSIYNTCMEIASWTPGDNGRILRNPGRRKRSRLSNMSMTNDDTLSTSFPFQEEQQTLLLEQEQKMSGTFQKSKDYNIIFNERQGLNTQVD